MARSRRLGRLFWKFFLVQWLSMALTMTGVGLYFHMSGLKPPPGNQLMLFGLVPVAPLIAVAFTMMASSLALAWYLSRPLWQLSWALGRVSAGHLDTRVAGRTGFRSNDVMDLADDFDRMARQLQVLTESRSVLLHDISHELRSPLTRLQVAIGLLKQQPLHLDQMLERIERESGRLDTLIEELLTWHRLEAGAAIPPASRVDVIELLHAIAEDAQFEALASGKTVVIDAPAEFVSEVHGELIYRGLENVIRNAVKFTYVGGQVEITARVSDDQAQWTCTVKDRGPGVPVGMLDTIFEPFARVAGSEGVQGVGLGLAICRRAMALHGGRIDAQLRPGGGLTFTMVLPRSSCVRAPS
ncbi:HAMP domain-containing sensor histidine kinase [Aquabacterium sp. CECT 9606]|uniref:HAMP domain-containing sensor histidine kinase n=1 Tax=Aquabacterium sp. CECT 9606 TaxID=2845822 RepID=UPI001E486939|nr:HAMP domain-containing sensor histidine kinase [Aquabacterium sp. CECT 9606]CAH0352377.1 Adaptive-response sensory-kinase SasA [Aquabacterium sp. CECT 9606]